jgi:hypothetical protein
MASIENDDGEADPRARLMQEVAQEMDDIEEQSAFTFFHTLLERVGVELFR